MSNEDPIYISCGEISSVFAWLGPMGIRDLNDIRGHTYMKLDIRGHPTSITSAPSFGVEVLLQ